MCLCSAVLYCKQTATAWILWLPASSAASNSRRRYPLEGHATIPYGICLSRKDCHEKVNEVHSAGREPTSTTKDRKERFFLDPRMKSKTHEKRRSCSCLRELQCYSLALYRIGHIYIHTAQMPQGAFKSCTILHIAYRETEELKSKCMQQLPRFAEKDVCSASFQVTPYFYKKYYVLHASAASA